MVRANWGVLAIASLITSGVGAMLVAVTGFASVSACGGRVHYDGTSISSGGTTELDAGSPGGALPAVAIRKRPA